MLFRLFNGVHLDVSYLNVETNVRSLSAMQTHKEIKKITKRKRFYTVFNMPTLIISINNYKSK